MTTLSTTMLQTPTSLSGEICERPSHSIDFELLNDRLPGGVISCSVAFGSAAIQVNWTLVTRHCLPKTMCNCTTFKGPGVEDHGCFGLGCRAAVCDIDLGKCQLLPQKNIQVGACVLKDTQCSYSHVFPLRPSSKSVSPRSSAFRQWRPTTNRSSWPTTSGPG